ncbi:MAG: hypothetical protein Q7S49_00935 [bacterium]|nr:hypothetical protein [bacterium]
MNSKSIIWVGMFVGSALGGYVPLLWGGSLFSFTSVILTAAGGVLGIYFGFKISNL